MTGKRILHRFWPLVPLTMLILGASAACTRQLDLRVESVREVTQKAGIETGLEVEFSSLEDWISESRGVFGGAIYANMYTCDDHLNIVSEPIDGEAEVRGGRHIYKVVFPNRLANLGRWATPAGRERVAGWPRSAVEASGVCFTTQLASVGSTTLSPELAYPKAAALLR